MHEFKLSMYIIYKRYATFEPSHILPSLKFAVIYKPSKLQIVFAYSLKCANVPVRAGSVDTQNII